MAYFLDMNGVLSVHHEHSC